ncbi:MAG: hypothetical protein PHG03_01495 [Bacilli bacterium]|nr:hypothetical protein [Bacilli bacterium]MDD4795218.1 hypothetical protein [Bacilli bacterium]
MKKILILLLTIIFMPINGNALAVSETFEVGDRVKVLVSEASEPVGHEFFVIRPSIANDPYVWLLLNENVMDKYGNAITVFDERIPDEHEDLTIWEKTIAYEVLQQATESWRPRAEVVRLLQAQDLVDLGLPKNTETGEYEIMGNRKYLAPISLSAGYPNMEKPSSAYNFWTEIYDESAEETSVFAVILNEDYAGDTLTPLAYIRSHEITSITDNYEFVLRPVIKIHKQYIDCFVDATTTVSSPPTAEVKIPFEVVGLTVVAVAAYLLIRKKEIFNRI